jgi:RNA polymerase sigma factor (sigma-70 family)
VRLVIYMGQDTSDGSDPDLAAPESPEARRRAVVRKLFEDHNRALVSFLAARLNSYSEARDAAQEAYVRILQLEDTGAVGFLRAYLFRTAANIAVDRLRRRTVRQEGPPIALFEELLAQPGPERNVLASQELDVVKRALRDLPEKCRRAFALHMFRERSIAEIAREMGVTERMVRHHIAEALAYLHVMRERAHGGSQGDLK